MDDFDMDASITATPKQELHPAYINYIQTLWQLFENTDDGKEILKAWQDDYLVMRPNLPPEEYAAKYPDWYPFVREGENRFIRQIMTDLRRYKNYKEGKYDRRSSTTNGSPDDL